MIQFGTLCVYIKINADLLTIIAVYVDDFFIFSNDVCEIDCLKLKLSCEFRLKDLGQARQILGMKVTRNKDAIILDQTDYINCVLNRFSMSDCKPAAH